MRSVVFACVLTILAAGLAAGAAEPRLAGRTVLMNADAAPQAARRGLWAIRLSPDGEHLLFPRRVAPQADGDAARPGRGYQVVLRHCKTGKEKVVPMPLLVDVNDTLIVATSLNPFGAGGKLLVVPAAVDSDGDGVWAQRQEKLQPALFDIPSGKLKRLDVEGLFVLATFDASGKQLIVGTIETMQPLSGKMYITPADKIKLRALSTFGLLRTPSPVGTILAHVEIHVPAEGERPVPKFLLFDYAKNTRAAELPLHERNTSMDDYAPQWTADGRYLYYVDQEMEPTGEGRTRRKRFTRVWDTRRKTEAARLSDLIAVGPGGGATGMILTKPNGGVFLHDAKTGSQTLLTAEESIRPVSVTGKYLIYVRQNDQGNRVVCRAEIQAAGR